MDYLTTDSSANDLEMAKAEFEAILAKFDATPENGQKEEFFEWISANWIGRPKKSKKKNEQFRRPRQMLLKMATRLRELAPLESYLVKSAEPAEQTSAGSSPRASADSVVWPSGGTFTDCQPHNTIQADEFLLDDEDMSALVWDNTVPNRYCRRCGAQGTMAPMNMLSHSLSRTELDTLFTQILPPFVAGANSNLSNKVLVDIGSRLGAVLWAAALYWPSLSRIVGIERDAQFHSLQQQIAHEFAMSPPVELVHADFRECTELLTANNLLLVMHNVFSFFMPEREQADCWHWLHAHLAPGTLLVHCPSLPTVTRHLSLQFAVDQWLQVLYSPPAEAKASIGKGEQQPNGNNDEKEEEGAGIWLYLVK